MENNGIDEDILSGKGLKPISDDDDDGKGGTGTGKPPKGTVILVRKNKFGSHKKYKGVKYSLSSGRRRSDSRRNPKNKTRVH